MEEQSRVATYCATDAYTILARELAAFRALSYQELVQFIGPPQFRRVTDRYSVEYLIDVTVRWRSREGGDVLVVGWIAVDDCGPMRRTDGYFIVAPPSPEQTNHH